MVDPWGTAIKVDEYLTIYELNWLSSLSMVLSIWLSGVEMLMGCMLLFKVRIRLISIFALISMSFFTVISFLSATVLPVEDCGCFGEAIKLTPWQTFTKNLILLPMIVTVWYRYKPDKILVFKLKELVLATIFFVSIMSLASYCYFHLPLIDFLPYKVGVNLREAISESDPMESANVVLIYRNRATDQLHEFTLEDTEWYDESKWEWVETQTIDAEPSVLPLLSEFMLRDIASDDVTNDILATQGKLYMICVTHLDKISKSCNRRIVKLLQSAEEQGAKAICITPDKLPSHGFSFDADHSVEIYNIDASTMKTMLRASVGVVEFDDGVIISKKNCIDL